MFVRWITAKTPVSGNSFAFPADPEDEPTQEIQLDLDIPAEPEFGQVPDPPNNEKREYCWWCGEKTVKKLLLNDYVDFCEVCKK
jgi:hypothetical protein